MSQLYTFLLLTLFLLLLFFKNIFSFAIQSLSYIVILYHKAVGLLPFISLMCLFLQAFPLDSFCCQIICFLWFLFQGWTLQPANGLFGQELMCIASKGKIWSANHMANLGAVLNTCVLLWRLLVSLIIKMFTLIHSKLQDGNTEMIEEN